MKKLSKDQVKAIVGVYVCCMAIMSILVPVPILAAIVAAFPDVSVTSIQMIVAIPSFAAIAGNFLFAKLATKMYRRSCMLLGMGLYLFGLLPYFFHGSIIPAYIAALCSGLAMGGTQVVSGALISDYFEGDSRGVLFGLCSLFVGIGGVIFMMIAGNMGAIAWYKAYLAYLAVVPMFLIELLFMPKGNIEVAKEGAPRAKISKTVLVIAALTFVYFACNQVYSSNISLLLAERSLGGTAEAGNVSSVNTLCGAIGGLFTLPFKKLCRKQSLSIAAVLAAVGSAVIFAAGGIPMVIVGTFLMAFMYAVYNPIGSQYVTEASNIANMSINLAVYQAAGSLGNFFSPIIFGAATASVGTSGSQFMAGAVVFAVVAVVSFAYYAKAKIEDGNSDVAVETAGNSVA